MNYWWERSDIVLVEGAGGLMSPLGDEEYVADLAADPRYAAVVAEGQQRLRGFLDPEEVDARAKRRQKQLLDAFGGREAALARGDLGFSPAPGTRAEYN